MFIIDTHCHLGTSLTSGLRITEEDILQNMERNGVNMSLVMPFPVTEDPIKAHNAVASFCNKYPERLRGIASLSPLVPREQYVKEIQRCIKELKFVGIKFHPMFHMLSPLSEKANIVFETANRFKVPVIVHTGMGIPNALPSLCIIPAKEYPDVPIVLAHAGTGIFTSEAYVAAWVCPNIYLEPSWCMSHELRWLIKEVGADRIMMGSDLLSNLPVELTKYRSINLDEDELEKCLSKTAAKLFQLPIGG